MAATLEELERRVLALEKGQHELQRAQNENTVSLKWLAGTLAQVEALAYTTASASRVSRGAWVPSR